jgi:hypothetical protein
MVRPLGVYGLTSFDFQQKTQNPVSRKIKRPQSPAQFVTRRVVNFTTPPRKELLAAARNSMRAVRFQSGMMSCYLQLELRLRCFFVICDQNNASNPGILCG